MDFQNIPLFSALKTKMHWLQDRQRVLATNVANANTPRFEAQDLKEPNFEALVNSSTNKLAMQAHHQSHMSGARSNTVEAAFRVVDKPDAETTPGGNSVVIEQQMMKVAETQMAYKTAVGLYNKSMGLFRIAIGRGNS